MGDIVEFVAPLKGELGNIDYSDNPLDATISACNVLPWDRMGRQRIQQRRGTTRLFASAVGNGGQFIQALAQTTFVLDPSTAVADQQVLYEPFTYANGRLDLQQTNFKCTDYQPIGGCGLNTNPPGSYLQVSGNQLKAQGNDWAECAIWKPALALGTAYVIKASFYLQENIANDYGAALICRVNTTTFAPGTAVWVRIARDAIKCYKGQYTAQTLTGQSAGVNTYTFAGSLTLGWHVCELRVNGNYFTVWVDGYQYCSFTDATTGIGQTGVGFGIRTTGFGSPVVDNFYVYSGKNVANFRQTNLVAICGGNVYQGTKASMPTTPCVNGTSVFADSRPVQTCVSNGYMYCVDGTNTKKVKLSTQEVQAWTADSGKGTVPTGCTVAATWRDRVVLAAPIDNPQNFFFSRVGNANDWQTADTDPGAAFGGNASTAGHIGEPIVALIPFNDDVLLIGGDHMLWAMRGDPMDGGSIDMVSDAIGILGPNAWCKSPEGIIYFVGTGGLFRMVPGGTPENISAGKWNTFFKNIDRSANFVAMAWDRDNQGCYIFVTPANAAATTHLWYDLRTDSFWPIQFPNSFGPTASLVYDGDGPDDRLLMLGSRNGLVHMTSNTATNDDGTAITSWLVIGPYKSATIAEIVLEWCDVLLGEFNNGWVQPDTNVRVQWCSGPTAQRAYSDPQYIRWKTFTSPGRQVRWFNRSRGNTFFLTFYNDVLDKTWVLERVTASFMPGGLVRRR